MENSLLLYCYNIAMSAIAVRIAYPLSTYELCVLISQSLKNRATDDGQPPYRLFDMAQVNTVLNTTILKRTLIYTGIPKTENVCLSGVANDFWVSSTCCGRVLVLRMVVVELCSVRRVTVCRGPVWQRLARAQPTWRRVTFTQSRTRRFLHWKRDVCY